MTPENILIDFTELISAVPGEGLEQLVRQIGLKKGLSPIWSGRGADEGKDLIFTEILSGSLTKEKITWLVSCKDKSQSGESVKEKDLPAPSISDKLAQHKANGFLLVTTTTVSTGAKALLDSLDKSTGGVIHTLVWDSSELRKMLLDPSNQELVKQFLPASYRRVKGLTSIEGALIAFQDQIPNDVFEELMQLVRPYSANPLEGSMVWPYDSHSAQVIDKIVRNIFIDKDIAVAVMSLEGIEYDAFVTFLKLLQEYYPEKCREYLFSIILTHQEPDIRFNAAQYLFDNFEISAQDMIKLASNLDSNALEALYSTEIVSHVELEIINNTHNYELFESLDELSSRYMIEDVNVSRLAIDAYEEEKINFSGDMTIWVALKFDGEEISGRIFPGIFSGFIDAFGIYLISTSVDTLSYFG